MFALEMRFTEQDKATIRKAIENVMAAWMEITPLKNPPPLWGENAARVGRHSIGCSADDLRQAELDWIEAQVAEVIASYS